MADDSNFGTIDQIYEYAEDHGYRFICLTASTEKEIAKWQNITGAEYPFYTTDATTLKTMIRSNPGLMLLHNGTIIQKWSHNELPAEDLLAKPLERANTANCQQKEWQGKFCKPYSGSYCHWYCSPLQTAYGHGQPG